MATDTQNHCNSYDACNQAKPGVDILKIPCHVRAFQDYFTKWPIAIPLKDQRAESTVKALIETFSIYGIPTYIHFEQGANF